MLEVIDRGIEVKHKDKTYLAQEGKITRTMLGKEDHGIFTFLLDFEFPGGSGQGAGSLNLNDPVYFGALIHSVLNFFGTDWERLVGKRAYVLREERNGYIRGLMDTNRSKVIIFSEVVDSTP